MKRVTYTHEAIKVLKRMDSATRQRIVMKIDQLAQAPEELSGNIKKLQGSSYFRLRVGDWRIIYADDLTVVAIVRIAPRGEAY